MATLKSQKMVSMRDTKTPLAKSVMDKPLKNGNGNGNGLGSKIASGVKEDPPKKNAPKKGKKTYTGRPEYHTKVTYGGRTKHYKKGEAEKTLTDFSDALKSGKIKKIIRSDGRIEYKQVKKKKN